MMLNVQGGEMARILIVEDDDEIRELLSEALMRWGHETALAPNGQEGLQVYRQGQFDLILSDVRMPVMDGLTLLKTIREKDRKTPVIIVTAYPTVDSAVESLGLGADFYLVKPVNFDDLQAKMNKCLENGRIQNEADKLHRVNRWLWAGMAAALILGVLIGQWI